jgi:hypothetical protein
LPNLLLATVSLGITLAIGELVLRTVIASESPQPFEFRIPHPVFGWVLQPNASYQFSLPDGPVSVMYNSRGWRDIDHTFKKPEGVFRIVVLGDSFMEANTVELGQAFPRRVEEFALAAGLKAEVINLGVGGYGTLQEYLVFRDIALQYEPDLVILAFYPSNDLTNNGVVLASILATDGAVPNTRPFLEPGASTEWALTPVDFKSAQSYYAEGQAQLDAKRKGMRLFSLAQEVIARVPFEEAALPPNSGQPSEAPTDPSRQEMALLGVNYCVEPAEYTQAWTTTERILARLNADVEAAGSRLVVFAVPAIENVSLEYADQIRASVAHPEKLCLEEAPAYSRLREILLRLGIEQIELLPDFRAEMREDETQLFQTVEGMHWTPVGHDLAAEQVVLELIERDLLSGP